MKKLTITIGIPAYNEEKNISLLLRSIYEQKAVSYMTKKIVIVLDGCSDSTYDEINKNKRSELHIINGKKRFGQQVRQNQILRECETDVTVLLEADTILVDDKALENLIRPFMSRKKNLGVVFGRPIPIKPKTFLEKILFQAWVLKRDITDEWKNGANVFSSTGHAPRALHKKFYSQLIWPESVPEDSYLYFTCINLGFNYKVVKNANTYMRNVTNLKDRIKQCRKFHTGRKVLLKHFSARQVDEAFLVPKQLIIKYLTRHLFKNPILTISYIFEAILNRVILAKTNEYTHIYEPYNSSKLLRALIIV